MHRCVVYVVFAVAVLLAFTEDASCNPTPLSKCVLPPYPDYGSYTVSGWPNAEPGMSFDEVTMNVTCDAPMRPVGPSEMRCSNGKWSVERFTHCWYFCKIPQHPSVTHYCGDNWTQKCDDYVISDTSVLPKCNDYYHSRDQLMRMFCLNGRWMFTETCDLNLRVSNEGNNVTLRLGNLVLRVSGSQYNVAVDLNSETVVNESVKPGDSDRNVFTDYDYYA